MTDYLEPRFELRGCELAVFGELTAQEESSFEESLDSLIHTESNSLVIDLTGVTYLSSSYVRLLALALVEVRKADRSISIKAHSRVVRLLKMGGLDKMGEIEVIEDEDE